MKVESRRSSIISESNDSKLARLETLSSQRQKRKMLSLLVIALVLLQVAYGYVGNRNGIARKSSLLMATTSTTTEFSKSVPFLKKPKNLDGLVVSYS